MFKTKTHHITRTWEYLILVMLLILTLIWSSLTNQAQAQVSTLNNNCLGTGGLSTGLTTFLNTKFVSSWPTQNKCASDVAVAVVAIGDLLSGNMMQYNVTVTNNGPRWSYNSRVDFTGSNWLITSTPTLTYNVLAPGTSQMLSIFVYKGAGTSSTIITSTGSFTLNDNTIVDSSTANNIFHHRPIVRWSTRPVCYNTALNIPSYECDALMDLYTSTNGAWRTSKTNWWVSPNIESWFGLTTTINDDLVAHYSFDASNAIDDAGNGFNGIIQNGWTITNGRISNAVDLDWIDDIVRIANQPTFNQSWPLTLSAWIRADVIDTNVRWIVAKWALAWAWVWIQLNGSYLNFGYHACNNFNWSTALVPNTWYHVAATFEPSGTVSRIYVNWVLDGTSTLVSSSNCNNDTSDYVIGAANSAWWYNFDGGIDEVRIYNRALSDGEISQLYNSNTIKENVSSLCLSNTIEWTACNYQYQWTAGNNMSGPLPSSIGLLSELTTLALSNNALGGTIPVQLTNLTKAWRVLLASTNLTGTLPSTIGAMTALTQLDVAGNNLNGAIPAGLSSTSINVLRGGNNKFTSLPDLSARTWSQLQLQNNLFAGSLPSWIGTESSLSYLLLGSNQFTGPIPLSWAWLTGIYFLSLHSNQLTWSLNVFAWLNATWIGEFQVHNNNLDRDHNNNAIVPANIQARLGSMVSQNLTNQWDITAPQIGTINLPAFPSFNYLWPTVGWSISTASIVWASGSVVDTTLLWGNPQHVTYVQSAGVDDARWRNGNQWTVSRNPISFQNDKTYTLSFWVRTVAGTRQIDPCLTDDVNNWSTCQTHSIDTTWKLVSVTKTYSSLGASPRAFITTNIAWSDFYYYNPTITVANTITPTIAWEFTYTLTAFENGSTTGAWFTTWLPIFFSGSSACVQSLYTTGVVTNRLGNTTVQVYVLELGTFAGCQIGIRDRANLASNLITLPTFLNNDYGVCNSAIDVPKSDCKALMDLYTSTAGNSWTTKTNWKGSGDATPTTICDWFGITCGSSRIASISMASNNIIGTLPTSITNLTGMNTLWLRFNQLTGSVPNLSTMTWLTSIYLDGNNLNWALPGLPTTAINIYLNSNKFSGTIPVSYCTLIAPDQLYFDNNLLTGSIPWCFANLNVRDFGAAINTLSWPLPSFGAWRLANLFLNDNQFSWPIPSSLGSATGLVRILLHSNNLQGFIPSSLANLTALTVSNSNISNNCLSPATSYMTAWLSNWLSTKWVVYASQKVCNGTLGSRVWIDSDNDWLYDNGETGTGWVTVTLKACTDQTPVNTWGKLLNHQLAAYYTFDASSALDDTLNGNDGVNNGATFVAGKVGNAASFNGADNKITIGKLPITRDFTISSWIRTIDSSIDYIAGNYGISSCNGGLEMYVWNNRVSVYISGYTNGSTVLSNNTWHHVVSTRSGNTVSVYINGVLDVAWVNATEISTTCDWGIGNGPNYTSEAFGGQIDDTRIYSRALSATEISQLYNIDSATLATNVPISYTGTTVTSTSTASNGTYSFANQPAGRYYLEYSNLPNGYKFTSQNRWWYHNSANSDVNPWSAKSSCFELYNGLYETDIDAGIRYLPYASCDNISANFTPVLVWQPVTVAVAWYGQNGQFTISHTGNGNPGLNRVYASGTITNQWTNRAAKSWSTVFTPWSPITYTLTWGVDGMSDKLEYYETVTSSQAYRVVATDQRCAVSQANLWPQTTILTTINQIATIPAPVSYCTGGQSGLPFAAVTNQPPKMLVKLPSCASTLSATVDTNTLCDYVTDMTAAECKELSKLYDATEWRVQCANQWSNCNFAGTRQVRYGNGWVYNYLTGTTLLSCNDATFGDPIVWGSKQCRYRMDAGTWTNSSNWKFVWDTTPRTACDWYGISCAGGRVTQINLNTNNLQKSLTWMIWSNLSALTNLELYSNSLVGNLPDMSGVSALQVLRLWFNQFTGTLPTQWSAIPSLITVSLANAWVLTGTIPASWSWLTNLEHLHLSNALTGSRSFPTTISSWTKLKELYLDNNGMTGAIPSSLFALTWLQSLQLQSNNLHGDLSAQNWSALTNLYTSAFGGTKSALENNCLYTGRVAGTTGTFLDARFNFTSWPATNWRNQKLCNTDLQMTSFATIGNLMTGVTMSFVLDYTNLGPIPSYNPIVTIQLASGLNLTVSGNYTAGRTTGVRVADLAPGQTGQYTFTINKTQLGSWFWPWLINVFRIDDPTRSDTTGGNNLITNSTDARGSSYPVCIRPDISVLTYECEALWDLYAFTNGSGWTTKTNWMTSPDVESWHGISLVTLTWVNYVQKICMATATDSTSCQDNRNAGTVGNNLSWSLQSTLSDLFWLKELRAPNNNINGLIPSSFANLDRMTHTVLHGNKITGMWTWFGGMAELLWLQLGNNPLTIIDWWVANAPKISTLAFEETNITSLPDLTSACDTLTALSMFSLNSLNTTIPSWFSWCTKLNVLNAWFAWLTGTITTQFSMSSLQSLLIYGNNLNGTLPTSLSTGLTQLRLDGNKFTWILPTAWSSLVNLQTLNLSSNTGLVWTLPSSWSGLRLLQTLNLSDAWLTGQIPAWWFPVMTGMRDFVIPNGSLNGPVPATWFQLWPLLRTWPITSAITNNCMYTGLVNGAVATWMNTYIGWATQRTCTTDNQLSLVSKSAVDYNPGKTITYTINYANNWPRWSYEPRISIDLFTGLVLSWTVSRTWTITLPILTPGQTGQVLITANKRGTGSGVVTYTNIFSIADTTTVDSIPANNTIVDSGAMRLFKYNECIDVTDVPQPECEAVMDFYISTNWASWITKTNWAWLWDATPNTLCDWYGLKCSWGRVTNLCLAGSTAGTQCQDAWSSPWGNNLSGSLLSTIGDLTELTGLFLWDNNLNGSIPSQVNNLTKLLTLSLWDNKFTWPVPTMTGLQQMIWLHLGMNQLAGTLPTWLAQMSQLSWVTLFSNLFTWPLPTSWTGANKLQYLSLGNNPLNNGVLPSEWSSRSSLKEVYIQWSRLTWSLPTSWGSLTGLVKINLSTNYINGSLPTSWTGMRSLQTLNLGGNTLFGLLPVSYSSMTGLTELILYGNPLVGATLPTTWSALINLQILDLSSSQLSGTLPASWSWLTKLVTLNLSSNNFSDEIPTSWLSGMKMLQSLGISDNSLVWAINTPLLQSLTGLVGNSSTIMNNCLYTGTVIWWYLGWMDTYFTTLWRTQRKCNADLQLTGMSVVGNMMSGAFMTYTFTYNNLGPSRAYLPKVNVTLYTWFIFVNGGGSTTGINLWYLRPNTSWSLTIPIAKIAVGSWVVPFTNTFVIDDTTSNDVATSNNTIIHTGTLRLFKYPICGSITDISQAECEALWDFYTSTNWSGWTNKTNWMWFGDATTATACDWFGVSCTTLTWWISPMTVDKLCMSHTNTGAMCNHAPRYTWGAIGNNLSGSLSPSISDLVWLTILSLNINSKLVWTLPSNINNLSKLKEIGMQYGPKITGIIPSSITQITWLQLIWFIDNQLTWSIPANLFTLPQLWVVWLWFNQLNGIIPQTWWSSIGDLYLPGNANLGWPLPSWIATTPTLNWLRLNNTLISGSLPSSWSSLTNLYHMDLSNMINLTGSLPSSWSTMTNLWELILDNNNLTWSLPSSWSTMTNLTRLSLSSTTNLTGTLPSSWSNLRKLITLRLNNNTLNGEIPSSWSSLTWLTAFTIANNNIDGPIPTWLNTSYPSLGINSSTISNNCMYTGFVSGSLLTYMNSRFGSNWQTQKICSTDLVLGTITASWSLNTWNVLAYTINYTNGWTRWLYNPRIAIQLSQGLAVSTTTGVYIGTLWALAPWQWTSTSVSVNKNYFTGLWLSQFANIFTLSDPSISDTNSGNNAFTHTGIVRGSPYPICLNSSLTVSQDDCEALMDLYITAQGTAWVNKANRWISPNVDTWFGISVANGRVSKLNLSNITDENLPCSIVTGSNNLVGNLPLSIIALTNMKDLCLGNNQLTGNLQVWLLSLTWLQTLSLHHNNTRFPWVISGMTSLVTLDMWYNNLTWSLSTTIWVLPSLKYLYLDGNQIGGWISQLSSYAALQWVRLNNNLFTGSISTTISWLNFLTELILTNNFLDRDHNNDALVPSSIVSWYNSITLRSRGNQWDIAAPILAWSISVPASISSWSIPITFTINENSHVSWSYTAWIYSWQNVWWLYAILTGAWYCSTISSDIVRSHTGVIVISIYPETDATYTSCQIAVRDRANNLSNYLTIPTFTYTQPPYRLHIRFSGSWVVLSNNTLQSINDLSSFANVITMVWWNPSYIPLVFNDNPAVQFNNSQSLMMPGIFRRQIFNDTNILMVVKPWSSSSSLLFEQAQWGTPVVLSTNSWNVWSDAVSFSLPTTAYSLINASHVNGWQHQVRVNGVLANTVSASQPLQVTGISITTIGSWLWLWMLWEVIVYTSSLSGVALNYLESYLAVKYGITLPSNYTAVTSGTWSMSTIWTANPTYQHQVIWLGRNLSSPLPINQRLSSSSSWADITLHARGSWSDGQYTMVGATSGDVKNWTREVSLLTWYKLLPRTWYVQKTGTPQFDISVTDTSIADFNFTPTIFISNSPSSTTIVSSWELVLSGTKWITSWITITNGQYFTFGIGQSSMWGRVWLDLNRDGIQSPSEPSVAGVKVKIRRCPVRQDWWVGPWYLSQWAVSPQPMLKEQITTTGATNYMFTQLNAWEYYMTYDRSQAIVNSLDGNQWLTGTQDATSNPWSYNGGNLWSDYEAYSPWNNNKSSLWYGFMTSLSGIDSKTIDSDLLSTTYQWYTSKLPQSSQCYSIRAWSTQSSIWAWLMLVNSTDLSLTHSLNLVSIDNVSWSQFNLTVNAINNGAITSHYTQIVIQLPAGVRAIGVTNSSGSMSYVVSWLQLKIYNGALNPNTTSTYTINLIYDWSEDDGDVLTFGSTLMSTTVDTNPSNNTPVNQTLTLLRKWASIGNKIWIDANLNGIQDSNELNSSLAAGLIVELRHAITDAIVKPSKQSSLGGEYLFSSVWTGAYYIFVTNLPRWFIFTDIGVPWSTTVNDSNINPATNKSDTITITDSTDNLSIDIGLKSISPLSQCSIVWAHKMRLWVSYTSFIDTYTAWSILWHRLLSVDRIWTEVADHNQSAALPTLQLYNNGRWYPRWYIAPSSTQTTAIAGNPAYIAIKAPLTRAATGQMIVSYNYLWCYTSAALPQYCQQAFRYNSCHTYEITACGDGIVDSYTNTWYIWSNWWSEECDNGAGNDGITVINNVKCKVDCMINRDNIADLAVTKRDIIRNMCELNSGSDGIWWWSWSLAGSGNRATLVTWSTTSYMSIVN